MGSLSKLRNRLKNVNANSILSQVFKDRDLRDEVVRLNTEEQMYEEGVDSEGKSLGQYAPITVSFFKPKAALEGRDGRTDHITLKDTGEFYRSFNTRVEKDGIVIVADAIKEDTDLTQIYPALLGLTNESLNSLIPDIREAAASVLRSKIVG